MNKIISSAALLALCFSASAQEIKGSGKIVDQAREIADFTALRTDGAFQLVLTSGSKASLKLSGDDNLLPLVESTVKSGELVISMKHDVDINIRRPIKIELTVPKLVRYSAEGAGSTTLRNLSGERLDVSFHGAGVLKADGTVQKLTVDAEGAGAIDFKGLKATDAKVSIQGVGSVNVYASGVLDASVEGIGRLTYYGHPKTLRKSANGLGSVGAGD